ncbi:MAG: DUF1573 domain-containing protein [Bacteroidales bacterium]|nr:DUF1573 domain-containing protein [Bacteroidales bacterium]MCF8454394.1 DUF1573 domain-containing protein [Bacteroidales bacterium]
MKKVVFSIFVLAAFVYSNVSHAQGKAFIKFDKTEHDYGQIKEADGKANATFSFTNTGTEPLIITEVKPNCGCTTPSYTKAPIPPKGTGFVTAAFDPANRPGVFNKTIRVTTNAENSNVILRIKGDVVQRERGVEDDYPHEMGPIRLSTNHLAMQNIGNNQSKTDTIKIINNSDEVQNISFQQVPAHITINAIPKTLKAKAKGIIVVNYNAATKNDWGFVIDRIPIVFNEVFDPKDRNNRITVSANIEEDFSKLSEADKAKAPKIEFESKTFDFGTIKQGETSAHLYKFKNTGKSDLVIRKTKASCGCTVVDPEDKIIAPGASSQFNVKFNSRGKKGKQNKTITVITNDPNNPSIILKITGDVTVTE